MKFRPRYEDRDRELHGELVVLHTGEETPTVQDEAEDADINTIVRRFGLTGQLPTNLPPIMYGDFTGITDFRTAMDALVAAKDTFMELPGDVRSRFNNDPQEFLEFCEERDADGNRVNLEDMRKFGLAVPKAVEVESRPVKVEVINPPPADSSAK